jgi:saccharopine dehydrogenase-like NADP-dependent oxidoreductase
MPKSLRICILGGCGLMGRVIVKCLRRFDRRIRVTVADRQKPAGKLPPGVSYTAADLRDHRRLVQLLRKHDLVVNSTSHHFNLPVMKAALEAGIHYLDLGGLFHYTRRQLKHHRAFEKKDVLAILGMGCAPGVANLLAAWAAEEMERVEEIHIKVGGRSWNPPTSDVPYAAGTIREELTNRPAVFTKGRWTFAKPQSGKEKFPFPAPVGRQKISTQSIRRWPPFPKVSLG